MTLTIDEFVAVDNVTLANLTLVPNPVRVEEQLFVAGEFSAAERNGLIVSVYNAVGQKVYEVEPNNYPIVIDGLQHRGVYVVRVVTGTGDVRQGKIIVE